MRSSTSTTVFRLPFTAAALTDAYRCRLRRIRQPSDLVEWDTGLRVLVAGGVQVQKGVHAWHLSDRMGPGCPAPFTAAASVLRTDGGCGGSGNWQSGHLPLRTAS